MDFLTLLQNGNAWLFIPSAILLGALHGLEPGHSKTMMAAFIVAVHGTVKQAIMLGLAATVSHTLVVWLIALGGLYISSQISAPNLEPWIQLISGVLVLVMGAWMLWRIRESQKPHAHEHHEHSNHEHSHHEHSHHDCAHDHHTDANTHQDDYFDDHERYHAMEIKQRFENKTASNTQILIFGLTGGLIPCPAAVTVLLICLQLKEIALGSTLVLSFSVGLAITLVSVGVVAAIGVRKAKSKWAGLNAISGKAPYLSGALICLVGGYMMWHGWSGLNAVA